MNSDQPHLQRAFGPALPHGIESLSWAMWQMLMMIGTAWWNGVFDAFHPSGEVEPRHVAAHEQLVVPEAIEADGEHVFA